MKIKQISLATLTLMAIVAAIFVGLSTPRPAAVPTKNSAGAALGDLNSSQTLLSAYGRLPLRFEANKGQTDPAVKFVSRGLGYSMFMTSEGFVLVLSKRQESAVVRMRMRGTNPESEPTGEEELGGKANYFIGDPSNWRTNVPTYAKVRYREVYPGIDSIYYGSGGQLEYDFVVSPGADPGSIRVSFDGSDHLKVDAGGDLLLQAGGSEIRFLKPVAYQQGADGRHDVAAQFVLLDERNVSFSVGQFDRREPLVIDPTVSYSTFLGGSATDSGAGIAVDGSGAYITGVTTSTNFPTTVGVVQTANGGSSGSQDVFVTKLNPTGSALVYSTYLGGNSNDYGEKIAVDSSGNAYVTGFTISTNFPTTVGAWDRTSSTQDAFITKLNSTGSMLLYSTYLGGDTGTEIANFIIVDASQNAYVVGSTTSTDFPITVGAAYTTPRGAQDVFVTKVNAAGSGLVYSTYLGGSGGDSGAAIAVDGSGNAFVTGNTTSTDFPVVNAPANLQTYKGGEHDAFLSKLNASGSALTYSMYIGGGRDDAGLGIALDGAGDVYLTGSTNSGDFSTQNPFQAYGGSCDVSGFTLFCADAFVAKVSGSGTPPTLLYSSYLGGTHYEFGFKIVADGSGNAYVVGITLSSNFPTVNATQGTFGGGTCTFNFPGFPFPVQAPCADAFISKVNPAGSALLFSTFLGGSNLDGLAANSTAVNNTLDVAFLSGGIYVAGSTASTNFPTVSALYSTFRGGDNDAFVVKIQDTVSKKVRAQVISQ